MTDYSRIDTMIWDAVISKPKKIAVCPFAEAGMMAKQILNQRYGIEIQDYPSVEEYILGE